MSYAQGASRNYTGKQKRTNIFKYGFAPNNFYVETMISSFASPSRHFEHPVARPKRKKKKLFIDLLKKLSKKHDNKINNKGYIFLPQVDLAPFFADSPHRGHLPRTHMCRIMFFEPY